MALPSAFALPLTLRRRLLAFVLVVLGLRVPSERLRLALQEGLSAKEWRFVRGEIDTLTVARGPHEEDSP